MTLVTLGDSDVRMVALIDVTVAQGELPDDRPQPARRLRAHQHSGGTLEKSDQDGAAVTLTLREPAARRHQP